MRRLLFSLIFWAAACPWLPVQAAGTAANATISTQAVANYTVGPSSFTQSSNVVTATVAEVLDVIVTWQDGTPVYVTAAQTNQILSFRITNTGNGTEQFALAGVNALTGDDFDPAVTGIFLDTNSNGTFDTGIDQAYIPGTNDPILTADQGLSVFALANIPAGVLDGNTGLFELTAAAATGHGPPGTLISGLGDSGTDAITGTTGAQGNAIGTYAVSEVTVTLTKSAVVADPYGGNRATTGSVITYQVLIQAQGSRTATDVIFTDPIPAGTLYNPNSLNLNAAALTDGADADAGDAGITNAGTVTVALGDLSPASPVQTISFSVTIK